MKNDFDIRFTKSSKPGGQNVNKVETCVVITHKITGLTEKCEDTRSKEHNKNLAMSRLLKKIKEHEDEILQEKTNEKRKKLIQNRKTIRTYNYNRNEVYDHRTKTKANLKKVMNGEIDLL